MAPSTPRVGPSPGSVLLLLLAAAVVGFLGGAMVGLSGQRTPEPADVAASSPAVPTDSPAPTPTAVRHTLTLVADRQDADLGELIRLEGRLDPPQSGVVLQVQQAVNAGEFADFPVTVTTRNDGTYGVWVLSGLQGRNQFRLVTTVDGDVVDSPPAVVVVG